MCGWKETLNKIFTLIIALMVSVGSASITARAVVVTAETETETVDPQEEKLISQYLAQSRLTRQKQVKNVWEIFCEDHQGAEVESLAAHDECVRFLRDFHIPILRAPPSTYDHS